MARPLWRLERITACQMTACWWWRLNRSAMTSRFSVPRAGPSPRWDIQFGQGLKSANPPSVDWRLECALLAILGRDHAYSAPRAGTYPPSRPLRSARHLPRPHVPARSRRQEQMPLLIAVDPWWTSISDPSEKLRQRQSALE